MKIKELLHILKDINPEHYVVCSFDSDCAITSIHGIREIRLAYWNSEGKLIEDEYEVVLQGD